MSKEPQIVVLDGKNGPHALFSELKNKFGLPVHFFMREQDGTFVHNPPFKGNNYSWPETRAAEIEQIRQLHQRQPVGAVIFQPGDCNMPKEFIDCVKPIHEIDPNIKIIAMGRDGFLDYDDFDERWAASSRAEEKKVVYAGDGEVKLKSGIAAFVDTMDYEQLVTAIRTLLPTLQKPRQQSL